MIYMIGLVGVVCLYIVGVYAINRASAEALIKDLMKIAQGTIVGGVNKKDFVNSATRVLLKDSQIPSPISAKIIEKQIDKIIEKNVPEIKEEIRAQGEKIDLGAMDNSKSIIDMVMVSEEKGIISVYGKAVGDTGSKVVNWEAGLNIVKKIK